MAEDSAPAPRGRVSNEVLEERLTQYFVRTTEALEGINAKLDRFDGRLERAEGHNTLNTERIREHEHLLNHPEAEKRLTNAEKTLVAVQAEVQKLNHVYEIEKSVSTLTTKVDKIESELSELQSKHIVEDGKRAGRTEVFTSFDKSFVKLVLLISLLGTVVTIIANLDKLL